MDTAFEGEKFAVIGESRGSYHAMGLAHTRPNDILKRPTRNLNRWDSLER